jgi:ribosomal protein S18 acetylase RimI-like enzyme
MRIVAGEPRHVAAVWALVERCRDALARVGVTQWDAVYPTRETVEDDVRRRALWMLEGAGAGADDIVGCVTLTEDQDPAYVTVAWTLPEPALVVHRLCIDPAMQGRGRAHRLMDFAESHAAAHGYASIRLDAYTGNPRAVALYRRRGYREAGQVFFPRRTLPFYCFERSPAAPAPENPSLCR